MKNKIKILLIGLLAFTIPNTVHGAVGTVSISGTTMDVGEMQDLTIQLSANVASADGTITSNDPTCVSVESVTSPYGNGNYFMNIDLNGNPISTAGSVKIKGLKDCKTTLNIAVKSIGSTNGRDEDSNLVATSGEIVVGNGGSGSSGGGGGEPSPGPGGDPSPGPGGDPTPSDSKSSDANLKSIIVSKGSLSPEFDPSVTSYTVDLDESATAITIGATANDSKATVSGIGIKTLSKGPNTYTIKVTAEDGTRKEYTITVNRGTSSGEEENPGPKKSSDASLSSLDVSGYTLSPRFSSGTTGYSMTVNNNITGLDVTAIAKDPNAKVEVSGNTGWSVGVNNIRIKVTAEDGTVNTYIVAVTRKDKAGNNTTAKKSSDATLSELLVKNGELNPKFSSKTTSYTVKVPNDVDKLDLSYVTNDSKAKVKVTGNENFKVGEANVVEVTVTAEDGTIKIYTINVEKSDKEGNNKLKDIIIGGGGKLSPKFDPDVYEYKTEVDGDVDELDITAIAKNDKAKVEVIGNKKLKDGNNAVLVKVTDENGFVQYYKIDVFKKANTFSIFGLKIPKWLGYLLLGLLFLLIFFLLFLLFKKRRRKAAATTVVQKEAPTIEFKPEFNFGSKNEDNDTVSGGVLSQGSGEITSNEDYASGRELPPRREPKRLETRGYVDEETIPYDPYDDIVTKDEIIDAIKEKDPEKLKILYEQEMLNRKKEKLKAKEDADDADYEEVERRRYHDEDDY